MRFTLLAVIFFTVAAANLFNRKINIPNPKFHQKMWEDGWNLLQNTNTSVDPCDNFYEFVCGNFDNPHSFANRRIYKYKLKDDFVSRVEHYARFETNSSPSFKIEPLKLILDFYYSCKNTNDQHQEFSNEDDTEFLNEIISKLGGWPVVEGDKWNETDFSWEKFVEKAISIGYSDIPFYSAALTFNRAVNAIEIRLTPPKTKFSNEESVYAYRNFMTNVAILLGATKDQAKDLEYVIDFKRDLRMIYYNNKPMDEYFRQSKPLKMTVKEMMKKWPTVDWIKYLNSIIQPYVKFTNETMVHVYYPYFTLFSAGFENETPKRVQANYAIWNFIEFAIPYLKSKTLWDYRQTYLKIKDPSHSTEDDKLNCGALIHTHLGLLRKAYFLRQYPVDESTRSEVREIYTNVKNKFIEIINSSKWLDSNTKIETIDKLTSLKAVIGYPDGLLNDEELKNYFKGLEISRDNFLKNYLNVNLLNINKKSFSMFNDASSVETDMDLFTFTYDLPNRVMYDVTHQVLNIPVDIFSNYYYDVGPYNYYLNYGIIGTSIGQELIHTLDSNERGLKKTRLKYKWSNSSNDEYQKQENCMINQYAKYLKYNITLLSDGTLVDLDGIENFFNNGFSQFKAKQFLAENIADNIGTKVAYLAYQDWVTKNGYDPNVFGIYFSNQFFWISYASKWCQSKSVLSELIDDNIHPPNDKRVIGVVSNSIEFSNDFNCPVGSNMNPLNKCNFF